MRRLQLFGRSKSHASRRGSPEKRPLVPNAKTKENTSSLGLLEFPPDVLCRILNQLDNNTLLCLCQVHTRLYKIVSNQYLYKHVKLEDKLALLKFNAMIHTEFRTAKVVCARCKPSESQNARFLVQTIEFKNPQCHDSLLKYSKFHQNESSLIGGTYLYDSTHDLDSDEKTAQYIRYTYIELMLDIIDYLPNLTRVTLSDVQPGFKIPFWYSAFNDGSRDFFKKILKGQQSINSNDLRTFEVSPRFASDYESKFYSLPRIKVLEIKAAKDKRDRQQVALRPNLLCCFGVIDHLILESVIIDTESLDTPLEFVAFHLRLDDSGVYDLHSPVHSLTLQSCQVIPGNGILRLVHDYFKCVRSLQLLDLTSKYDMLLCSCFNSLTDLTIDCNSKCFTNERLVSDSYYYQEDLSQNYDGNDCDSLTETLCDVPEDHTLSAPPPTTPVVMSLNLNYLSRNPGTNRARNKKQIALITKSQGEFFRQFRVPEFHYFYHYYKQLWDRLPRKNINVSIINIPFTNVYPLSPQLYCEKVINSSNDDQQTLIGATPTDPSSVKNYYWDEPVRRCLMANIDSLLSSGQHDDLTDEDILVCTREGVLNDYNNPKAFSDIPNLNLWCFLKSLSKFKSVKIQMFRQWLFCTPRSRYDWELLLRPVLNVNVPIEVRDKDGFVLYSYGSVKKA
ncbi:SKP2 (YNL311C) [Zygosaccharomyces parabailii]|nr:SKP2 (YNL311C) [Zygosaccharomyces parabailii]